MSDVIQIDPDILSGTPVFKGTRVPAKNLFDYLRAGKPLVDFLDDFPAVSKEQALKFLQELQEQATKSRHVT